MVNEVKQRFVEVDRGLFILRYASADDEQRPPSIAVFPRPAADGGVEFVLHPDNTEAVLWRPGACLVVRASSPVKLEVVVTPADKNGSTAATVRIEPLSQGALAERKASRPHLARPRDLGDAADFRVRAHVASIGDVESRADQWIAGPSRPSRIEGFCLEWPGIPDGLELRYSVKTARAQAVSGQMMRLGDFAGTKGKSLGLVGVSLEMSGPAAEDFQFVAEAIFLGSPSMRVTGRRIELAGPTGREPLVGLRVSPQAHRSARDPAHDDETRSRNIASQPPSSRVRVVRSGDRRDNHTTAGLGR